MPDENIQIVVSEKGVSEAAEKVIQLAAGADRAEASVGKLKTALADMKSSGLTSLAAAFRDAEAGGRLLSAQSGSLAQQQRLVSQAADTQTASLTKQTAAQKAATAATEAAATASKAAADASSVLAGKSDIETAAYRQLAEATINVTTSKTALSVIQKAVADGTVAEVDATTALAGAMAGVNDSTAQLVLAKTNLAEVQEYLNTESQQSIVIAQAEAEARDRLNISIESMNAEAATAFQLGNDMLSLRAEDIGALTAQAEATERASVAQEALNVTTTAGSRAEQNVTNASRQRASVLNQETEAVTRGVSANVSAAASLGLMEGRTMSMNRAAANFLTKILPMGPILEAAFPIIGLVALISVFDMAFNAAKKWVDQLIAAPDKINEAWRSVNDSLREANDSTQSEIDKLTQANDKLEHKYDGKVGMQVVLDDLVKSANAYGKSLDDDLKKFNELSNAKENKVGAVGGLLTGQMPTQPTADIIGGILAAIAKKQSNSDDYVNSQHRELSDPEQVAEFAKAFGMTTDQYVKSVNDSITKEVANNQADIKSFIDQSITKLKYLSPDVGVKKDNGTMYAGQNVDAVNNMLDGAVNMLEEQRASIIEQQNLSVQEARNQKDRGNAMGASSDAKELTKNWKDALAAFVAWQHSITITGTNPTSQDKLDWWTNKTPSLMQGNKPKGDAEENKYQTDVNNENWGVDQVRKLQDLVAAQDKYGESLKETTMQDKILQEAMGKHIQLTDQEKQAIAELSDEYAKNMDYSRDLSKIYKDAKEQSAQDQSHHDNFQKAGAQVISEHPELHDAVTAALNRESEAYKRIKDPLYDFNKGISDQTALLDSFGQQQEINTQLQALQNQQTAQGHALSTQQIADEKARLQALSDSQILHADLAELYGNEADALHKLTIQQQAYDDAYKAGKLSKSQYMGDSLHNQDQQTDLKNANNQGTAGDIMSSPLKKYADTLRQLGGIAGETKKIMNDAFKTMADGAADAFAKWVVYGGSIKTAFANVARQGLEEIISGLAKMLIQALLLDVVFKALHLHMPGGDGGDNTKQTAQNTAVALASILTVTAAQYAAMDLLMEPAWSLAEAVSLFSFGANAAAAETGMTSVITLGQTAQKKADGGLIGGSGGPRSDNQLTWLSPGEFVMTAAATAAVGPDALDAVNKGAASVGSNSPGIGGAGLSTSRAPKMVIEDHTQGVKWQTVQIGADEMRVIARDEGKNAVYQHSDDAVAGAMANPNSKSRKALKTGTNVKAVR